MESYSSRSRHCNQTFEMENFSKYFRLFSSVVFTGGSGTSSIFLCGGVTLKSIIMILYGYLPLCFCHRKAPRQGEYHDIHIRDQRNLGRIPSIDEETEYSM